MNSKLSTLALSLVPGLGPIRSRHLIEYCSDATSIFNLSRKELRRLKWLPSSSIDMILNKETWKPAERILADCKTSGMDMICYNESAYPLRLKQLPDAPVVLYRKGNMSETKKMVLGIVGTRMPSKQGLRITEKIITELNHLELIIVSGLAYGIDIQAHKTALEVNLSTESVLGGAIDRVYPVVHQSILTKMCEIGGAWSEFPPGTEAERAHFPMRNRILAGLCDMVLVVESRSKGGSMITASLANQYNREVGAIPGSPGLRRSQGCNLLIKSQAAHLIESAADIMALMQWNDDVLKPKPQRTNLRPEQKVVIDFLNIKGPVHLDVLKTELDLKDGQWAQMSLELEMSGAIEILPGNVIRSN